MSAPRYRADELRDEDAVAVALDPDPDPASGGACWDSLEVAA